MKERKKQSTVEENFSSAQFDESFTRPVRATIDNPDHGRQGVSPKLLDDIDIDTALRYSKRAGLLRQWLDLPSVTLEQATWLLLGRDPFDTRSGEIEAPHPNLELHYKSLLNILECEVIGLRLRPIGKTVSGLAPRFNLPSAIETAKRLNMANSVVAQYTEMVRFEKQGRSPEYPQQTQQTHQRYTVNRAIVDRIRAKTPELIASIAPEKPKASRRRKFKTEPVNVGIKIGQNEYIRLFLESYKTVTGEELLYTVSNQMHKDDRAELNIKLARGRRRVT